LLILNSTNRILPLKFNDNVTTPIVELEDETESEGRISDKDQSLILKLLLTLTLLPSINLMILTIQHL
jgi:hypothetical protein